MVLLGDTAEKIEQSYKKYLRRSHNSTIPVIKAKDMEDAVKKAYNLAESGDCVVLSPASASFDLYSNFMERGNHFKEIVSGL